jgi:hypothetical protein
LARFPEQNVAVALLCNGGASNPADLADRVSAAVLGPVLAAVASDPAGISLAPAVLAPLAGVYRAPRTEEINIFVVKNGKLVDSLGGPTPLIALAPDRFQYPGSSAQLVVVPAGAGGPARLRVEQPNTRPVEYEAVARPSLDAKALAGYAGEYKSPELGATYQLVVRGDTLLLDQGWRGTERLVPIYQDGFELGNVGIVRFTRDAKHRLTGFTIWAGRVRHLRFDRVTPK